MNALTIAKYRFQNEDLSFVLVNEDNMIISEERGIIPMYKAVTESKKLTKGASVADKVVGKAAAMLAVYGKISYIFAELTTFSAIKICKKHGIEIEYDKSVKAIQNRDQTGDCPMEQLSERVSIPKEMVDKIAEFIALNDN